MLLKNAWNRGGDNTMIPFMSILDASRETGLSQGYLRSGCKNGSIPHIMAGRKFMVNIPALLRQLDAETTDVTDRQKVMEFDA